MTLFATALLLLELAGLTGVLLPSLIQWSVYTNLPCDTEQVTSRAVSTPLYQRDVGMFYFGLHCLRSSF